MSDNRKQQQPHGQSKKHELNVHVIDAIIAAYEEIRNKHGVVPIYTTDEQLLNRINSNAVQHRTYVAREMVCEALATALECQRLKPVHISFPNGKGEEYPPEALKAINEWANRGLVHLHLSKIVGLFTTIGVDTNTAMRLTNMISLYENDIRRYLAYTASH
jgi:hypothetical protein